MATRRNPIRLNLGPMSGRVMALTNYRVIRRGDRDVTKVIGDGKHDVHDDFVALALEQVLGDDVDLQPLLRRMGEGDLTVTLEERQMLERLADRLGKLIDDYDAAKERHDVEEAAPSAS